MGEKKVKGDWDQAYLWVAILSWLLRVRLGGGGASITALTASKVEAKLRNPDPQGTLSGMTRILYSMYDLCRKPSIAV
jgi:hypothetical protein